MYNQKNIKTMLCASLTNILSSASTIFAILLLVSELLPYASSSKCNSIVEGVSHIFCRTSCFVSNKNIRFENDELKHENVELKEDNKVLVDEINQLKQVVLHDIADEIQKLRKSFEKHKDGQPNKKTSSEDEVVFIQV
jgi:hypothetical protein